MEPEKRVELIIEAVLDEMIRWKKIKAAAKECNCFNCHGYLSLIDGTVQAYATWGKGTTFRSFNKKWARANRRYFIDKLTQIVENGPHNHVSPRTSSG